MNIPFFDLQRQTEQLKPELDEVFNRVLKNGQFILGEEVENFEREFAQYLDVSHCVSCANGTDAIELVLEAYRIEEGDEVILPAFGWVSASMAVERRGAKVAYVDVEYNSGNINVELVEEAITSRTKMVIATHLYGNPFDVKSLSEICLRNGVILIEDCAQAHGAVVDGRKVGGYGDTAIFSFYPTKNLGCFGDGGAVLTNDHSVAQNIRMIRNYGRDESGAFTTPGRNSRLDEIQAAILRVKLRYLDKWNVRRKEIAQKYDRSLNISNKVNSESVFHHYTIRSEKRSYLQKCLLEAGVSIKVHYPYAMSAVTDCENALELSNSVLSLPSFPELTELEISYICEHLIRNRDIIL